MENEMKPSDASTFDQIRRTRDDGMECWFSREFARALGYENYRNFEQVLEKAKTACVKSNQPIEDHFVDIDEMIMIGKGAYRPIKSVLMSRYACYLAIQNADPGKPLGFAVACHDKHHAAIQTVVPSKRCFRRRYINRLSLFLVRDHEEDLGARSKLSRRYPGGSQKSSHDPRTGSTRVSTRSARCTRQGNEAYTPDGFDDINPVIRNTRRARNTAESKGGRGFSASRPATSIGS